MGIDLTDRVIAITGASSGIGAATAQACAAAGMRVALGARRRERLDALAGKLGDGARVLVETCDVDQDEDVARFIERTRSELGGLDAVFANAGFGHFGEVAATTDTEMRAIFETNFFGTMRVVRAAVPIMRAQGRGHVLICSSAVSEIGLPMYGPYCATKAAQDSIASAMRAELADEGVHVSSVHPVGTRTDLYDLTRDRSASKVPFNTPSPLPQTAEHVAKAIVRCLRKPKAEVWPHWPSRLGLAIVTAFPALNASSMRSLMRKRYKKAT
ncbi:MAG: short-chain dehydrogenase [Phycisphaeraceae bacterium]|nr:short-chain dehydrogenase [Phycisphaeraceae bacterium]